MKFVEVKELPKKRGGERNRIQNFLKEFMNQNVKFVKIEFKDGEYSTWKTADASMRVAVKRSCLPIKVECINEEIYLVRKDM